MLRKPASIIILSLLVVGALALAYDVQPVKSDYAWTETIYIRADGSIKPPTAPISSIDNVTYMLTDNIEGYVPTNSSAIIIQRDNITIDGAGHALQGILTWISTGIDVTGRSNVTIKNMKITAFFGGINLDTSYNNSVSGNNLTDNADGIALGGSSNNSISGNNLANNGYGIELGDSSNNSISGNNITASREYGIELGDSSNNSISGNNLTANTYGGVFLGYSSGNSVSRNSFDNDGLIVYGSYGNVATDNLVNGKPLVYLEEMSDYAVGDAGQVILVNCSNIIAENINLSNTNCGVQLWETNNTIISGNNITGNNQGGILLDSSSDNSLAGNNITNNSGGIGLLDSSSGNSVSGNNIANSNYGIEIYSSSNNTIYHNNFMNNTGQAYSSGSTNVWDDGYPSGGNYWSDYVGQYPNATQIDNSGIWNTPYAVNVNTRDEYPLMNPCPAEYAITFDQVGAGSDFTGTVVTVEGTPRKASELPVTFAWPMDSVHTFAFQSPLNDSSGTNEYDWTSTNGLSTLQSGSITITGPGSVNGNYATRPRGSNPDEVRFLGTAIDYFSAHTPGGPWGWDVSVDKVTNGPIQQGDVVAVFLQAVGPPWGYMDPRIQPGNKVAVYGSNNGEARVSLIGSDEYYIELACDVAVTNVVAVVPHCSSKVGNESWVFQGLPVYVNVTVLNKGYFDENLTVTLYHNITANQTVGAQNITLSPGQNETVAFVWDTKGVPYCLNYTLTAVATIPLDINPADNTQACGPITVRIKGDINGDGKVDGKDIALIGLSFGTCGPDYLYPGSPPYPRWNLDCDTNGDNKIDGKDLTLTALNFGKAYP